MVSKVPRFAIGERGDLRGAQIDVGGSFEDAQQNDFSETKSLIRYLLTHCPDGLHEERIETAGASELGISDLVS